MTDAKITPSFKLPLAIFAFAIGIPFAQAAPVGPITTFTAGNPAKASEVNGNFNAIVNTVNANDARLTTVETNKQNVILAPCPPGSAIRAVAPNGAVTCQDTGGTVGFASVSAMSGVPLVSTTATSVCFLFCTRGAFGRFMPTAGSDFLVVPINLPHGATITTFSFSCLRNTTSSCGAFLFRDDGNTVAFVDTVAQATTVQTASAPTIDAGFAVVDNQSFSYIVWMSLSNTAGVATIPIRATVTYTLP